MAGGRFGAGLEGYLAALYMVHGMDFHSFGAVGAIIIGFYFIAHHDIRIYRAKVIEVC